MGDGRADLVSDTMMVDSADIRENGNWAEPRAHNITRKENMS